MEGRFRTDLALEQRELSPGGGHELEGVEAVFITRDEQVSWTSGLNDRLTLLNNG